MNLIKIFNFIPEVKGPDEKKLGFNIKLKWTLIILISFFVLANIPLFGLSNNALEHFKYLAVLLATEFGSLISLGIGPIIMGSIILQLLVGSGIINIDTKTSEGRKFFQGIQKLLVFFFIIFESIVYVLMKGLEPLPGLEWLLILQLILGGVLIFYMNEVCEKWGFGSGISLFIAAGVSWSLFTSIFQFMDQQSRNCLTDFSNIPCSGKFLVLIQSIINKSSIEIFSALATILVTIFIFLLVVWAQSLKVEIPLSFGRLRGYALKWPLSFFYASVLPVILVSALMANIQLFGGLFENWLGHPTFLGSFVNGQPVSGLGFWLGSTNLLDLFIKGGFLPKYLLQGLIHIIFFVVFCTLFSVFWVKTSGMDSKSQAEKIAASGLQISGFRQDNRILESVLDRYIMPLTIMGGASIGFLAATTNLMGALIQGNSMLLVTMILYQFYQSIAQQHLSDMNPGLRKFMGSG